MHDAVEVAGEVALQEACGFSTGFAFGDATVDVLPGLGVVLAAVEDDGVEGPVELAVAAAAEAVAVGESARGGERCDAGEPCEGCFRADAVFVRPAHDQLRGDDRSDACLVEEFGGERADVGEDLAFEERCLVGGRLDALGERAEREDGGEVVGGASARAAEATAAPDQLGDREQSKLVTEGLRRGHDHAAELDERDPANVDGASPGDHQYPQRFLTLSRTGSRTNAGSDNRARRAGRVERVVLAAQPPFGAGRAGALVDGLVASGR